MASALVPVSLLSDELARRAYIERQRERTRRRAGAEDDHPTHVRIRSWPDPLGAVVLVEVGLRDVGFPPFTVPKGAT